MAEYIGAAKYYPFTTIPNRNIYSNAQHTYIQKSVVQYIIEDYSKVLYSGVQYSTVQQSVVQYSIVECSTVQCSAAVVQFILLKPLKSNFLLFLEEASTGQYVGAIPKGPHTLHRNVIKSLIYNMRMELSPQPPLSPSFILLSPLKFIF